MEQNHRDKIKKIFELLGYADSEISFDDLNKRISILIPETSGSLINLPKILPALEKLINLMLKKSGTETIIVDVNNYRRERERLIIELAKAAAHKALLNKMIMELPPMNSYERRLIHIELAAKPDLITESVGIGLDRRVVIKPIEV